MSVEKSLYACPCPCTISYVRGHENLHTNQYHGYQQSDGLVGTPRLAIISKHTTEELHLTPSRQVNTYGYLIIAATLFEPEQTLNQFKSPATYDEAVVSIFTVNQTLHTATPNKNSISITSFQKKFKPFMPRK